MTGHNHSHTQSIPQHIADELESLSKQFISHGKQTDRYTVPSRITQYTSTLENHGYDVLGTGAGRLCVTHTDLADTVVKVAKHSGIQREGFRVAGTAQNAQELRAWRKMPDSIRASFNPVHDVGTEESQNIVASPRVRTGDEHVEYNRATEFVNTVRKALRTRGWDAVDLTVTEVGETQGDLVVYDYGLPVAPVDYIISQGDVLESDYRRTF